jgi:hypothetical protein
MPSSPEELFQSVSHTLARRTPQCEQGPARCVGSFSIEQHGKIEVRLELVGDEVEFEANVYAQDRSPGVFAQVELMDIYLLNDEADFQDLLKEVLASEIIWPEDGGSDREPDEVEQ